MELGLADTCTERYTSSPFMRLACSGKKRSIFGVRLQAERDTALARAGHGDGVSRKRRRRFALQAHSIGITCIPFPRLVCDRVGITMAAIINPVLFCNPRPLLAALKCSRVSKLEEQFFQRSCCRSGAAGARCQEQG